MHTYIYTCTYVRGRGRVHMVGDIRRVEEETGEERVSYINKHRTATEDGRELLIKGWVQWGDILAEGNASAMDPHEGTPTHVHLFFTSSVISSPMSQACTCARARVLRLFLCLSSISSPAQARETPITADPRSHNALVSVIVRRLGHLVASGIPQ